MLHSGRSYPSTPERPGSRTGTHPARDKTIILNDKNKIVAVIFFFRFGEISHYMQREKKTVILDNGIDADTVGQDSYSILGALIPKHRYIYFSRFTNLEIHKMYLDLCKINLLLFPFIQ